MWDVESLSFHRIQLQLTGLASSEGAGAGDYPREHFFLYPRSLYRPGDEARRLHRGLLAVRLVEPARTPYERRDDALLHREEDTGLRISPVTEEPAHFFIREGAGGIASFDLNGGCSLACRFCSRLERRRQLPRWLARHTEADAVDALMAQYGLTDLRALNQLSVVTGHFGSEDRVLDHLLRLLASATARGFGGDVYYAGAELVTEGAMEALALAAPGRVYYAVTVDVFTERRGLIGLRSTADFTEILRRSQRVFRRAYYNYVLGLEPFETFRAGVERLSEHAIPYVSIYNTYSPAQEELRAEEARQVDYFLRARDLLWSHFGARVYMHDAPFFNVSNRALFAFPPSCYEASGE